MRHLDPGYVSEVDTVDDRKWYEILEGFDDSNIYQTWAYGAVTSGRRNLSHLILKKDGAIVAVAQARIAKLPFVNVGIAYVPWGPLWRHCANEGNLDAFRQAVRALRNEFVCKRRLVLRLFPILFDGDSNFLAALKEEGFSSLGKEVPNRTILMDLRPPLEDLRAGMGSHWKRELKIAERNALTVTEGSEGQLFEAFIEIYKEMVSRKKFLELNDINQFKLIQEQLPENLKMKIMLCRSGESLCAGLITSAIGQTAIYLFGATSNAGLTSRGSYLLHWKLIGQLKQRRVAVYDLNGINPTKNPGTYRFKKDLGGRNGKNVYFLGRFDSRADIFSYSCVACADTLRRMYRRLRELAKHPGLGRPREEPVK